MDRIKIWSVLTTMPKTHIVGAGMAGLAAAVKLSDAGHLVTLYEAANHAGGRCRSFHDAALDCVIDNGNHLLLSGNTAVFKFLKTIGSEHTLEQKSLSLSSLMSATANVGVYAQI